MNADGGAADLDAGDREAALTKIYPGTWRSWDSGAVLPHHEVSMRFTETSTGRTVLSGLVIIGESITADDLRALQVRHAENTHNLSNTTRRAELERLRDALPPLVREPDTTPEQFSRLVAAHYRAWAALVPHPAQAIAKEYGINVPTVHTWVREARLRGMLPPGDRRKRATPNSEAAGQEPDTVGG